MFGNFKIGDLGHLFVLISFIASAIASFAYWRNTVLSKDLVTPNKETLSWKNFARGAFFVHVLAVLGIVSSLFMIIYNHHYEYYYAWDHSSNDLPIQYMISCFWEGQEGSFLLWIFWQAMLGLILIKVNKTWEAPLMAVFCLVQAFLASMIVGVVIPYFEIKIGSSPFILFKEQMSNLPVFAANPNYVPKDGSGLNALLQNYWMVIHPPTLFLGFALTLVPFAYCIAGIWQGKYKEWIRPALPWSLVGALILGTGILMGGYWAYETLNFGGYWNWDPVENAVYVPWLVLVGSIHTMITFKSSEKALKASIILVIATFILILYSTFLTRSGILGESSVHSFTDLGLSGQLLIYLLVFTILSIVMTVIAWGNIPSTEEEASIYSRELWILIGVTVLCLAAFQVLATTSIPVYNSIFKLLHIDIKKAPPAEQALHYSNWQLWFAVVIAILSGIGQFFWWKKIEKEKEKRSNPIAIPFIVTLLVASAIILFANISSAKYIILLTASLFSIFANLTIFISVIRSSPKLSGGAIAHIGIGMMLIGILFSSGYSKVISTNMSGAKYSKDDELNKNNVLLWRGEPLAMNEYTLTYQGAHWQAKGYDGYILQDNLYPTEIHNKVVAKKDIFEDAKVVIKKGDTLEINPENNFYKILFEKENGESFTLYPRVQVNQQMGYVVSPDIERFLGSDLYIHASSIPKIEEEREWGPPEEMSAKLHDTMFFDDKVAIFEEVKTEKSFPGVKVNDKGLVVKAKVKILGRNGSYYAEPAIIWVNEQEGGRVADVVEELGLQISLLTVDPSTHQFKFSVSSSERDWIILKALEKPMINVLWIGTLLLVLGLFIAIVRRYTEFAKMRDKGIE